MGNGSQGLAEKRPQQEVVWWLALDGPYANYGIEDSLALDRKIAFSVALERMKLACAIANNSPGVRGSALPA